MPRSAAALRLLLDQKISTTQYTRHGKALLLRWHLTDLHDPAKARRCRSVREQYKYDHRETDGLPSWL
jgi:hypothetical protein